MGTAIALRKAWVSRKEPLFAPSPLTQNSHSWLGRPLVKPPAEIGRTQQAGITQPHSQACLPQSPEQPVFIWGNWLAAAVAAPPLSFSMVVISTEEARRTLAVPLRKDGHSPGPQGPLTSPLKYVLVPRKTVLVDQES